MPLKQQMQLQITSRINKETIRQTVVADMYEKNGAFYLRYAEPAAAELGRTVTTVRLERGQVRLIRHGDVESELAFVQGGRHNGFYRMPHGTIVLEAETLSLEVDWTAAGGTARWTYRLYASGEIAGTYELRLDGTPRACEA